MTQANNNSGPHGRQTQSILYLTTLADLGTFLNERCDASMKGRLLLVLTLVAAASGLSALGPLALKYVIDSLAHGPQPAGYLALFTALYLASQWLARSIGEIRSLVYAGIEQSLLRTSVQSLFDHIIHLPLRSPWRRATGESAQIIDNALQGLQMFLQQMIFTLIPVVVELGTAIVVLTRLRHPIFLLLFAAALLFYGVAFALAASSAARAAHKATAARTASSAVITDALLNSPVVKCFAAESLFNARISSVLKRTEDAWMSFYRRYARNGLGVAAIFTLFFTAIILYATHEVTAGRMSVGEWVLVQTYMLQLARPVETLGFSLQHMAQGLVLLRDALSILKETPESDEGETLADTGPPTVEFKNVTFSYGQDRPALRNLSFRLAAGKTTALVGPSGSGKSTVGHLLLRIDQPDSGVITWDERNLSALSVSILREAIAVVPQDTMLFNDTLGFNIALGRAGATLDEIRQAAIAAHLHEFIQTLPCQYDTPVGERGSALSGGQRQRVAIARAAVKKPRFCLFDEPTTALDGRTEAEVSQSLRQLAQGTTTLLIAHRLKTVVHADEIIVLDEGMIAECGTHRSLLKLGGRYAAAWAAQGELQSGTEAEPEAQIQVSV